MRSKKTLAILLFILLPAFMYPAFSLTPEQCSVATENCIRACTGKGDPNTVSECRGQCTSPIHGPCAGIGASGANATNKGPAGPTKGTHPIVGVSPPATTGVNKGPLGGSTSPTVPPKPTQGNINR
jgi:hypothetical protein